MAMSSQYISLGQWLLTQKRLEQKWPLKNDSRITAFGKMLRVFRIDELPQIISVVKGICSL